GRRLVLLGQPTDRSGARERQAISQGKPRRGRQDRGRGTTERRSDRGSDYGGGGGRQGRGGRSRRGLERRRAARRGCWGAGLRPPGPRGGANLSDANAWPGAAR